MAGRATADRFGNPRVERTVDPLLQQRTQPELCTIEPRFHIGETYGIVGEAPNGPFPLPPETA